jgi:hypothetical protein
VGDGGLAAVVEDEAVEVKDEAKGASKGAGPGRRMVAVDASRACTAADGSRGMSCWMQCMTLSHLPGGGCTSGEVARCLNLALDPPAPPLPGECTTCAPYCVEEESGAPVIETNTTNGYCDVQYSSTDM